MGSRDDLTELRRGVLAPCVLALLDERARFGLEIVRDLAANDGLLTSEGTVYPLLTRLSSDQLVTSLWRHDDGQRARRYYSITPRGHERLQAFRADWDSFTGSVEKVLGKSGRDRIAAHKKRAGA